MFKKFQESFSIEKLWLKLLVAVVVIIVPIFAVAFLYSSSSTCPNIWDCLELELVVISGGIILFSLPIVAILFIWEIFKKIGEKKDQDEYKLKE